MASNPYVNRVDYVAGGVTHTLIDITNDTVTPSTLLQGYTAHDASGAAIVGTAAGDDSLIVTLSWDDDYFGQNEGAWVPDCTWAEVSAAAQAGKEICVRSDEDMAPADGYWEGDPSFTLWYCVVAYSSSEAKFFGYALSQEGLALTWYDHISLPTGTINITQAGNTDVTHYATASVPYADWEPSGVSGEFITTNNQRKWRAGSGFTVYDAGWITAGWKDTYFSSYSAVPANTTVTPSTSAQTVGGANYMMEGPVTVAAMPTGTAGTPTATKGAVSNHSVSVTPSVTNTTGYITGGTVSGTAVTVSASELVSGSETKTANGTYDVTNLAEVVVDVSGGGSSSMQVGTKTATLSAAASSISFTGLSGSPLAFVVTSSTDQSTGGTTAVAVAYDGTSLHGMDVTTQAEADTGYSKTYSNGTLTITATTASFGANEYKLVYAYGGSSSDIHTADVQVGSGATSITFSGLSGRPLYFSCVFKSSFSTSSGYQRVIDVVNDGTSTYGHAFDSSAHAATSWSYTYSGGSLTISSTGTNNGGYFHQPGYYGLVYAVDPNALSYQNKTGVGASTSSQTIYADSGYDALESVQIDPVSQTNLTAANIKSGTTVTISNGTTNLWSVTGTYTGGGGGGASVATTTWSNSSNTTTSHQFTGLSGTPIAAFLRCTSSLSRSSNSSNYFVADMVWNGSTCKGNSFRRSNGTYANVTSGYSVTTGTNSITFTSSGTSTTNPGSFYNGSYELTYVY